jgi:hypothetical protein
VGNIMNGVCHFICGGAFNFNVWESLDTQTQHEHEHEHEHANKEKRGEDEKPRWWIAISNEKYSCSCPLSILLPSATCLRESEVNVGLSSPGFTLPDVSSGTCMSNYEDWVHKERGELDCFEESSHSIRGLLIPVLSKSVVLSTSFTKARSSSTSSFEYALL